MLPDENAIRVFFAKLGLATEIADIYFSLYAHGPQTISELSRTTKVERTRIYRLIDQLLASNLIEVESRYKRGIIKAAPIANLHILINEKEQELKSLQDELGLIEQVLARNSLSTSNTRIQMYHGPEGIRQMLWNELAATTEILCYNYQVLDVVIGRAFMKRWAGEFTARGLRCRLMAGDEFAKSWQECTPRGEDPADGRISGIEYRYISAQEFPITYSCEIYNEVTMYYNWKAGDVFGVEIYNADIANTQRQFFDMVWPKSRPDERF